MQSFPSAVKITNLYHKPEGELKLRSINGRVEFYTAPIWTNKFYNCTLDTLMLLDSLVKLSPKRKRRTNAKR